MNILIFHECLFEVVFKYSCFYAWEEGGNDAKKIVSQSGRQCNIL